MNLNYIPYQLSDNQAKLTSILELVQSSDKKYAIYQL